MKSSLQDCRVMVVEDEYYLAVDVVETLRKAGVEVVGPFPGKAEALAALGAGEVDCAVIDVNLGQGASFGLADQLRDSGTPFIFFTGYDREVIPARFAEAPRLEKPADSQRLLRLVEHACGLARAEANP